MTTSTRPWISRVKRFARRSAEVGCAAGLIALAACAPALTRPGSASEEAVVRVGLVVDTAGVELAAGSGLTFTDPASGRRVLRSGGGERVVVTADAAGRLVLRTGGEARNAGASIVSATPDAGGTLTIAGRSYRGGALIRATGSGRVTAINQVGMEDYLLGVVPREIGQVGPELLEAAKAQAVAARTYAVRYLGRRESLGFDVFATVQDQVYGGVAAEHDPVSRAVRETAGEILTYRGTPIEAFYHSTCAGHTAAIEEVWPVEAPRPYLVSLVDVDPRTGEAYDRSSSRFQWTERWTADQLTSILDRTLADSLPPGVRTIGELRDIRVLEKTQSGRAKRVLISGSNADLYVGGDRIRWILLRPSGPALNSSKLDLEVVRGADGRVREVVATGGGWGHGIGMCQVGAMGRARAGQDYRTILRAYFQGAEILDLY
jgi:stage II sporulation protein D